MTPTGEAAKQYQKLDTHSNVSTASPHRLIQLMMERALAKIGIAKGHLQREEAALKGSSIGDAIGIINGLQASLNHKAGAELSANFDALYDYMMRRLLEANMHNEPTILDEVSGLLQELKEAWDAIADQVDVMSDSNEQAPLKS
ncbi:MAG: flagellar export chaperone FliS [Gammaproteobacteria bacterium]|nr:flagellar export chaperone FliS [Gammaproteobacteria bacterium]